MFVAETTRWSLYANTLKNSLKSLLNSLLFWRHLFLQCTKFDYFFYLLFDLRLNIMLACLFRGSVSAVIPFHVFHRTIMKIRRRRRVEVMDSARGDWTTRFSECTAVFQTPFYTRLFLTASSVITSARWIIRFEERKTGRGEERRKRGTKERQKFLFLPYCSPLFVFHVLEERAPMAFRVFSPRHRYYFSPFSLTILSIRVLTYCRVNLRLSITERSPIFVSFRFKKFQRLHEYFWVRYRIPRVLNAHFFEL